MENAEKLGMNISEVAASLGISKPKAYELAKRKGFPAVTFGRRIIVPREAFKNWLSKQENI